jgi:hypothetical protein
MIDWVQELIMMFVVFGAPPWITMLKGQGVT